MLYLFFQISSYKAHLLTHSSHRGFACTWEACTFSFKTKGSLKRHIRRHTGRIVNLVMVLFLLTSEVIRMIYLRLSFYLFSVKFGSAINSSHAIPIIKRPARDACLCMGELPAPPALPAPHFVFLITL